MAPLSGVILVASTLQCKVLHFIVHVPLGKVGDRSDGPHLAGHTNLSLWEAISRDAMPLFMFLV
jgi:hypothetical protein